MARSTIRFGTIARRQQAAFRTTLSPAAQSATDAVGMRNAHLLAHGYEAENLYPAIRQPDLALRHFCNRSIKWWTNGRSGDRPVGPGFVGPTRNLASSQVSCVNFLLPLAAIPGGLAELLRAIDLDVIDVAPIVDKKGQVAEVEFEWVGWDEPLEGGTITRGANQTSVDALVVARVPGGLRAYLIEWKYCEEYMSPENKGIGPSGAKRRSRYVHLFGQPSSSFSSAAPLDDFLFEPFYQIMRLLLLRDRMMIAGVSPALPLVDARVVVVCPAANLDYRNIVRKTPLGQRCQAATTVEQAVQRMLKNPRTFSVVAQDDLVAHLRGGALATQLRDWLSYHEERYGW